MSPIRPSLIADGLYVSGIAGKAVDGVAELLGGIPLILLSSAQLMSAGRWISSGWQGADAGPVGALIRSGVAALAAPGGRIWGLYLLIHGLVKVGIVTALLFGSRRAYPWAVGALGLFLVVQLAQLAISPGVGVAILTVLDALILWLTVHEWRRSRSLRDAWRNLAIRWRAALRRRRRA